MTDRPSILFLWIPRTSGSATWEWLERRRQGFNAQRVAEPGRPFNPEKNPTTFQHVDIAALLADGTITADWLSKQFVFAFVRNPWARLVSIYHHLSQGRPDQYEVVKGMTFQRMVEIACAGDIPPVGRYRMKGLSYCNPQVDWLRLRRGAIEMWLPNIVYKVEEHKRAMQDLCGRLGMKGGRNYHNRSRHGPWREYYDGPLRKAVAKRYEEEIDRFGYTFE